MLQRLGKILSKNLTLSVFILWGAATPGDVFAIEAFCPDGASPDANITFCAGNEGTTGCTTGGESACFTGNGYSSLDVAHTDEIKIITDAAKCPEGTRCIESRGKFGSSGPGYVTKNLTSDNYTTLRWRKYIRFENYAHYYHNHLGHAGGAGTTGAACSLGFTIEMGGQSGLYIYSSTSCGAGGFDLHPNQGVNPKFQNNKWYLIEAVAVIDTSCSNTSSTTGCNGIAKVWVDGTLVISYTNVNWGGVTQTARFSELKEPENYFHQRVPSWRPKLLTDALVISKSASNMIGPVTGVANVGSGDGGVYNAIQCGIEPFYGSGSNTYAPERDWAPSPGVSICGHNASSYRTAGSYSTTVSHTGVITDTGTGTPYNGVSRPIAEQSYRTQCSGSCGSGFLMPRINGPSSASEGDGNTNAYRGYVHPQEVLYGYVYLPSSSTPNDIIAYGGSTGKDTVQHSNYVAFTRTSGGFWGIVQKVADGTPTVTHTTAVTATQDTWHKFQIIIWDTQKVSLMIDDNLLIDKQALPGSVAWLFDGSHNSDNSGQVPGIIDYIGTGTVTAYWDDIAAGSVSFYNCDGWTAESCPFATSSNIGGAIPWIF